MDPAVPTDGEARRRRATSCLHGLLLAAAGLRVASALVAALGPPPPPDDRTPPLRIDVRTDPPSRLVLLPGIGPARAAAIVADRAASGPVPTLDALDRIHGIGPETVRRLRETDTADVVDPWPGD